jgi:uncharacterized lipoprotein YddW (UPF0748 family)
MSRARLVVTLFLSLAVPSTCAAELRGVWVVRTALVSPEEVDRAVDEAAEAGLNALLVQVRGRGDAFYRSDLLPRSPLLERRPADFDPLARLIARARERGLAVHVWVNVLLVAGFTQPLPSGHELARHPDWLMVPRGVAREALRSAPGSLRGLVRRGAADDPDIEGFYLSPSEPEARLHLQRVLGELLGRYAVEGVHLDFIRYPGPEYDFGRASLKAFQARGGSADPLGTALQRPLAWQEHLRESLTTLTRELAQASRKVRPGIVVSAAVVPDRATAVGQKFQDWPAWLSAGLLDALCPMTYTPDDRIFKRQLEDARSALGQGQSLWAGVGAYRLTTEGVLEKLQLARAAGARGVVLFSHESLRGLDRARLRAALNPTAPANGARGVAPQAAAP